MAFIIYLAQASLYAAAFWAIYLIVWRNRPLHRYSRAYLLAGLVLPVLLPFVRVPVSSHSAAAAYQLPLPEVVVGAAGAPSAATPALSAYLVLPVLYGLVALALGVRCLRAGLRVHRLLKRGQATRQDGYTLVTDTGIGPGTLGRRIFFPASEVDQVILQHELAHLQAGHRYDVVLLQVLQVLFWASPAHWLLGRELKMVHEFEADRDACRGLQVADYATLLLSQTLGVPPALTMAHSFFHHPLKRRIMMLQQMNAPRKNILLGAAALLTAGFMSTVLVAQTRKQVRQVRQADPATKSAIETPVDMDNLRLRMTPRNGEVRLLGDGTIAFKVVDQMPEFNGDLGKWLGGYLHYPDSARARGEEGRTIVQFTVSDQGQILSPRLDRSSGHSELDEEALRAVRNMPPWRPGQLKGKPVGVIFHLPITFRLDGAKLGEGC